MVLVNHLLCSKEITLPQVVKLIALVLLHFQNKVILTKVENVPVWYLGTMRVKFLRKKRPHFWVGLQLKFHT